MASLLLTLIHLNQFLSFGTTDIWGWIFVCCRRLSRALYNVWCYWPLPSRCQQDLPIPLQDNKDVSSHCQYPLVGKLIPNCFKTLLQI